MGGSLSVKELNLLLHKCIATKDLTAGRHVQRLICQHGYQSNPFLGTHLIRMFAMFGSLLEANEVFHRLEPHTVFAWSTIILAHVNLGHCHNAIELFYIMQDSNILPNTYIFVAVIKACATIWRLDQGMLIHAFAVIGECDCDIFVVNALIDMYGKCGNLEDARWVFDTATERSGATWSAMIDAYSTHEHCEDALQLFQLMTDQGMPPNNVIYLCVLKACSSSMYLDIGKQIHELIITSDYASDVMIGNALICMYAKCHSLYYARRVFDNSPKQDVVTWNAMVTVCGQHGCGHEAVQLFKDMQRQGVNPNDVTYASFLKAVSSIPSLEEGRMAHSRIIMFGATWDAFMESTLIDMYVQCGSLEDACGVFDNLPERQLVVWSAIISGLVQHMHCVEAFVSFDHMQQEGIEPNSIVFVCILKACSNLGLTDPGFLIHALATESSCDLNDIVANALIDMYTKTGSVHDARRVFDRMPKRDLISWNSMIYGCAEYGLDEEALNLFRHMQAEGKQSTMVTFVNALGACSNTACLEGGRLIHCYIALSASESDVTVRNTLIDMYARCERLDDAVMVFASLPDRNEVSWSAIIVGCVHCSHYALALRYSAAMQVEGFELNEVLFATLLTAYSHLGMVQEALYYLNSMKHEHDTAPALDHYCSVVDLLGRIGCVTEAEDLLQTIPLEINHAVYSSLLSQCKKHGNMNIGNKCFSSFVPAVDDGEGVDYAAIL